MWAVLLVALFAQMGAQNSKPIMSGEEMQKWRLRLIRSGVDPEVAVLIVFPLSTMLNNTRQTPHQMSFARVMTKQEAAATGVSQMSAQQRQSMEQWITAAVDHTVQECLKASSVYEKVGTNHNLVEYTQSAELIRLDDGSLWQVAPADRQQITGWKQTDVLLISEPEKGDFPYQITNGNGTIHARLVGRLP